MLQATLSLQSESRIGVRQRRFRSLFPRSPKSQEKSATAPTTTRVRQASMSPGRLGGKHHLASAQYRNATNESAFRLIALLNRRNITDFLAQSSGFFENLANDRR